MSSDNTIETFISEVDKLLSKLKDLSKKSILFEKEWKLDPVNDDNYSPGKLYEDLSYEMKANKPKLLRKEMHCVLYGSVSNGKSALINSLLEQPILPSHDGPTTNSFVEIKKSEDNTEYLILSGNIETKLEISDINRIDEVDSNPIQQGSRMELYLSSVKCPILEKDIVIVDTPGIDSEIEMDSMIEQECVEADVLIFVISCTRGLTKAEKDFLKKHKTIFSNFKIIIVFNFADKISSRFSFYIKKFTNEVNKYLYEELEIERESDNEKIFFICAKERLEIKRNEINLTEDVKERNDNFDNFLNCLQTYLEESSEKRRSNILDNWKKIIKDSLNKIKDYGTNLISRTNKKIVNTLNKLKNEKINDKVESMFNLAYEMSFIGVYNVVQKNLERTEDVCVWILKEYLLKEMIEFTESLKIQIKCLILEQASEDIDCFSKILKTFYFQSYLNISDKITESSVKELRKNMIRIIKIDEECRKSEIIRSSLKVAALGAGVGIAVAVAAPFLTLIAAPILGVIMGTVGGGATSVYMKNKMKSLEIFAFRDKFINEEAVFKSWWSKMKALLKDSYKDFLTDLPSLIKSITKDIEEDFKKLEEMNRV